MPFPNNRRKNPNSPKQADPPQGALKLIFSYLQSVLNSKRLKPCQVWLTGTIQGGKKRKNMTVYHPARLDDGDDQRFSRGLWKIFHNPLYEKPQITTIRKAEAAKKSNSNQYKKVQDVENFPQPAKSDPTTNLSLFQTLLMERSQKRNSTLPGYNNPRKFKYKRIAPVGLTGNGL